MLAPRSRSVLLAAPLVLLAACGGGAPPLEASFDAPADAARLVPADALAVFALESFDAASALVEAGGGEPLDVGELLGMLPGADAAAVARDAPVLLALRLDPAQPYPLPVWILPTEDADAFVAGLLPEAGIAHERSGAYVAAAPSGEGYAPGGATDLDLPGGVFAARVDLAALVEAFHPVIDTGLAQFEEQMSMIADMQAEQDVPGGMDLEPILEWYVDGARAFVDSADTFELSLWRDGARVNADSSLTLLPGSPLHSLFDGPPVDVSEALAHADESAGIVVVGAVDWGRLYDRIAPFLDAVVQAYPEPLREPMARVNEASMALYSHLDGPTAASLDYGAGGMRISGWTASSHAGALLEAYVAALEPLRDGHAGITVEGPTAVEVNGRAASEVRFTYGPEFFEPFLGEEEDPEMQAIFGAVFGGEGSMEMRLAAIGDEVVWAYGPEELAAVAGSRPGAVPDLAALVDRVGPAPASFALRMDVAALLDGFLAMLPMQPGDPNDLPTISMEPVLLYGAMEAERWRFGLSLDVDGLGRTVEAQGR